jgi:hypothetical protein
MKTFSRTAVAGLVFAATLFALGGASFAEDPGVIDKVFDNLGNTMDKVGTHNQQNLDAINGTHPSNKPSTYEKGGGNTGLGRDNPKTLVKRAFTDRGIDPSQPLPADKAGEAKMLMNSWRAGALDAVKALQDNQQQIKQLQKQLNAMPTTETATTDDAGNPLITKTSDDPNYDATKQKLDDLKNAQDGLMKDVKRQTEIYKAGKSLLAPTDNTTPSSTGDNGDMTQPTDNTTTTAPQGPTGNTTKSSMLPCGQGRDSGEPLGDQNPPSVDPVDQQVQNQKGAVTALLNGTDNGLGDNGSTNPTASGPESGNPAADNYGSVVDYANPNTPLTTDTVKSGGSGIDWGTILTGAVLLGAGVAAGAMGSGGGGGGGFSPSSSGTGHCF